jgi:hypothetical protein
MIAPGIILSLPDRSALSNGRLGMRVKVRGASLDFSSTAAPIRRALKRLRDGAVEADLADIAGGRGGETLAEWYAAFMTLERHGGVSYTVRSGQETIARGLALSRWFEPVVEWRDQVPSSRLQLSRFAYMHCVAGRLVLESPLSCGRVELHHGIASQVVGALAEPKRLGELSRQIPEPSSDVIRDLLWLLGYFGMLSGLNDAGVPDGAERRVLQNCHFRYTFVDGRG